MAVLAAGLRRAQPTATELRHGDHPGQVRGRGFRMTEWLRDRLRPRWMRLRRDFE